jgi:hypothetical protein
MLDTPVAFKHSLQWSTKLQMSFFIMSKIDHVDHAVDVESTTGALPVPARAFDVIS